MRAWRPWPARNRSGELTPSATRKVSAPRRRHSKGQRPTRPSSATIASAPSLYPLSASDSWISVAAASGSEATAAKIAGLEVIAPIRAAGPQGHAPSLSERLDKTVLCAAADGRFRARAKSALKVIGGFDLTDVVRLDGGIVALESLLFVTAEGVKMRTAASLNELKPGVSIAVRCRSRRRHSNIDKMKALLRTGSASGETIPRWSPTTTSARCNWTSRRIRAARWASPRRPIPSARRRRLARSAPWRCRARRRRALQRQLLVAGRQTGVEAAAVLDRRSASSADGERTRFFKRRSQASHCTDWAGNGARLLRLAWLTSSP